MNAAGFFLLLVTGLILYLPRLSILVGRRPTVKDIHFWGGVGWIAALALVALLGDRRGLLRTARRLRPRAGCSRRRRAASTPARRSTRADRRVRGALPRLRPAALFGEQDTRFRWASTVVLHDGLLYVSLVLLTGHLYLALIHPATRHSLRGMTTGKVSETGRGGTIRAGSSRRAGASSL